VCVDKESEEKEINREGKKHIPGSHIHIMAHHDEVMSLPGATHAHKACAYTDIDIAINSDTSDTRHRHTPIIDKKKI